MPELPEVETVRRTLEAALLGRAITGATLGDFAGVIGETSPDVFRARVAGRRFTGARRRGKYLLLDLDDETALLIHLRMTGHLELHERSSPPLRFEHLRLTLDDGRELRFADQRKFGRVLHVAQPEIAALEARLGPEPLADDFTAERLGALLARRTGSIKSVLLDQIVIAGLGNIYVDEALHRAGLHPARAANALAASERTVLHAAIQAVLREGLDNRGTSFSSFRDGYGRSGDNQHNLRVYGRAKNGPPCDACGNPIQRIVIGGRGTHLCPVCQPRDGV